MRQQHINWTSAGYAGENLPRRNAASASPGTRNNRNRPSHVIRHVTKVLLAAIAVLGLASPWTRVAAFSLDNNAIKYTLNASDGTEPLDNWWANEFTAVSGGNLITSVQFDCGTVTTGATAQVVIYRVTDPGGNPALGATRLYTQSFTPIPGTGGGVNLNQITLTNPVALNVGDRFLVALFMTNVIGAPPNDVYPFAIDNGTSSAGSYWDRSAPNTFNLDDLSKAKPVDQALATGGFVPGPGHLIIRAVGAENSMIPTTPTTIAFSKAGNGSQLQLSWPPRYVGWRLAAKTNSLSTTWSTVPGSTGNYQITQPINPTNSAVFYRLAFP